MKLRTLILQFFMLLCIVACDKDDEPEASIVGSWQGDKVEYTITTATLPIPYSSTDNNFDATIQFNADNTVTVTDDNQTVSGTYQKQGNQLTTDINFTVAGASLSGTYTIKELTNTKLSIYLEKDGTFEYPIGSGTMHSGTIKATLYFNRL